MSGAVKNVGANLNKMGGQIRGFGTTLTTSLTLPIVGLGIAMFKAFADFENVMAELQVRTGATGADMEMISDLAKQMGRDTVFSATEAAEAMLELTSSGSSAAEAMEQLPSVLNLAAAGAIDLGRAADGVTDVLAAFQLEAADAVAVTDDLARAAGSSSATVSDLLEGFANVGPVAAQFGLSVNDVAAALAVFAENGIKGAEAGTQLRSVLLNLSRNTETVQSAWAELGVSLFDLEGNVRNLDDVFKDVNAAMEDLPIEDQIRLGQDLAGSFGITGFNALRAANGISDMQANMLNAASAGDVAQARMNTLSGRFTSLMGSAETLGIVLGGLAEGPLSNFIEFITGAVNSITEFADANPELAQTILLIVAAVAALGPIVFIFGGIVSAVGTVISVIGSFIGLIGAISAGMTALATGSTIAAGGFALLSASMLLPIIIIGLLIAAIVLLALNWEQVTATVEQAAFLIQRGMGIAADAIGKFFADIGAAIARGVEGFRLGFVAVGKWLENIVNIIKETLNSLIRVVGAIATAIMNALIRGFAQKVNEFIATVRRMARDAVNAVRNAFDIGSPSKVMMEIGTQVVGGFNAGVEGVGGIGVNVPQLGGGGSSPTLGFAGAGAGGGNVFIENINVPPGTTREQADAIMIEIAKASKRRGAQSRL